MATSLVAFGLALAVPVTFFLAALVRPGRAAVASAAALGLALLASLAAVVHRTMPRPESMLGVRMDAVGCVMLMVVCGIGLVIVRFSRTNLEGDPGIARYFRWLLLTLSAVTTLVITNNLLVVAVAWTATSLALHHLLTFYGDRPAALLAAHKKFLVSRLADICLWSCLALVHMNVGSLDLDRIAEWAGAHPALTPSMEVAAVLVVVAVALRSAQLPFHGWLMQVMEAPTAVSALLHAGVVNIGGFVLIRLAPWMAHASVAQLLLVVIGLVTAVVAALVMTTRVSVKVALAWSTCAQMGFMLVECGLGAWHLALLHLVAHSLYKAHAFLSAGTAVEDWRRHWLTRAALPPSWRSHAAAAGFVLGSAAVVGVGAQAWDLSVGVLAVVVGLSVVPLLVQREVGFTLGRGAVAAAVTLLYVVWHAAAVHLLPSADVSSASSPVGWVVVGVGFTALFALKATLQLRPDSRFSRSLYPWLFAGFYLDERFTRATFRVWAPRLQRRETAPALQVQTTVEV